MEKSKFQLQGDAEIALWSAVYVKALEGNLRFRVALMTAPSEEQALRTMGDYMIAESSADYAVKALRERLPEVLVGAR